jgi:hypothetical protein
VKASESFTNAGTITLTSSGGPGYLTVLEMPGSTLTNNGTINVEAGAGGYRYFEGNLTNNHVLSIGAGIELKGIAAYTQSTSGTLKVGIGKSSVGTLTASGVVKLAGGLQLVQSGFEGKAGDKATIITGSTRNGEFAHVSGATIDPSLYYRPVYLGTSVALEVTAGEPPEKAPVNETKPTINGTAQQGSTLVATNGTWALSPFEYSYQWLRCEPSGSGCKAVEGAYGQSYLLSAGDVGHRITVQVTAYNSGGGSAPAEPASQTAVVSSLPLHAVAGEDISLVEGESALLDGSGSTPAPEIDKYRWQFGDGAEEEGPSDATLHHVYAAAGKYKARLTVYRGSEQANDELSVTVVKSPGAGEGARVTVLDASKQPIQGASVLYVGSDGTRAEASTDGSGVATLAGLPAGSDTVYAYKSGFGPAAGSIAVDAQHNGAATLTIASGEVATSSLKSKELNEEQIIAAGIDPSNPANQNVYEFEVKLAFINGAPEVDLHGYVNGGGEFVGSYGAGGGGGGWTCSPTGCEGGGGEGEGGRIVAVPDVVEGRPLIQWLILRGKAAVLKQFFEVNMVVQNLSPEQPFKLTPGSMTLNLPSGMSLAPTPEPQTLSQSVGVIEPKGSASATWIIRGDEPGEYNLSAAYHAKLEPFKAPVDLLAGLVKPLRVWGIEALKLRVQADSGYLAEGRPYHVRLGIENVADVPLYNVELSLNPDIHERFIFQPGQRFSEKLGEIKPNETTYGDNYILVPDAASEGAFNPGLSSATFVGQTEKPSEGIEQVLKVPPLYAISASPAPNEVHLSWQPVEDATAYEVFATKDLDTRFEGVPGQAEPLAVSETEGGPHSVTVLPKSATNAWVMPPCGQPRCFYAVSAIVEGHTKLESTVIPAEAGSGKPAVPPTVETKAASGVTHTLATLNGRVNPSGGSVSDCRLEYGPSEAYGSAVPCTPSPGSGENQVAVSASVGSLAPNTTYHFRISATNAGGTSKGLDQSFTTVAALPMPHWYKNAAKLPPGERSPLIGWGTLTLESSAGTATCRSAEAANVENTAGAATKEVVLFVTWECKPIGGSCTAGEQRATPRHLPWQGTMLEEGEEGSGTFREEGWGIELNLECFKGGINSASQLFKTGPVLAEAGTATPRWLNGTNATKPSEVFFDAASGHLYAEVEKAAVKGTTKGKLKFVGYQDNATVPLITLAKP